MGQKIKVLVMGPGASGTKFMAQKLETLKFETIHEKNRDFRNGKFIETCDWEGAGDWISSGGNRALVGFPYGFMAHYLRHRIPDLPIICLHREKSSWLHSVRRAKVENATSWPKNLESKEHYWDIYENLMNSITPPVLHLNMEDLDDCDEKTKNFLEMT